MKPMQSKIPHICDLLTARRVCHLWYNSWRFFSNGGFSTPFSVMIPAINSGGVISNAGLKIRTPLGTDPLPSYLYNFIY